MTNKLEKLQQENEKLKNELESNDLWKDVVFVNGKLDVEQVKKELHDYHMILENVSKVYDHVTGGKISKPNALAEVVIAVADDSWEEGYKFYCDDQTQELKSELDQLKQELDSFKPPMRCLTNLCSDCGYFHVLKDMDGDVCIDCWNDNNNDRMRHDYEQAFNHDLLKLVDQGRVVIV